MIDTCYAETFAERFRGVPDHPFEQGFEQLDLAGIGWVIGGGESGRGARPMQPDWVRAVRERCLAEQGPRGPSPEVGLGYRTPN